ncbi:CPBP family intramembrane metalloprotease [Roseibacterium sp. SDUM158017]|uniref:CPBP family intramembrane glutamic endopeptidase n=1 Tax=Roseicyclus salinarum TaxID=3036773 RepID=UPI0024154495|nr:CPBP family intramembrane glutamic endopeptidase [Roseibacterium sp. SDUM158017]MDG4646886.1 CPBP family intramembrane metalloprotease [Roseibacterium sp. SDUM158017]
MQYQPHAPFVAPARARPQLWRLALGLVLTAAIYGIGIAAVFLLVVAWSGMDGAQRWMQELSTTSGPTGTLLLLATFAGMALGPMAAARLLHRRKVSSLFGPLRRLWRQFLLALAICTGFYAVTALIPTPAMTPLPNLELTLWASFLPLALVGVLIQTGAEEVLFRGYMQQQLAARFASPIAWMVLPSAIFAALHYQPDIMGDNTWLMMAAVFVFAVLAADLTAATGSIGAAWGLHFANNALAILVVATDGPLSGLALFVAPVSPSSEDIRPLFYLDIATTIALWAAVRFAVTRPGLRRR